MTQHINIICPKSYPPPASKIEVIKALRAISGMGLKEAKDISENDLQQKLIINDSALRQETLSVRAKYFDEQYRILRNNGVKVGDSVHTILQEMRVLATQALEQGDDELANEILQLVLAEKLRRQPVL